MGLSDFVHGISGTLPFARGLSWLPAILEGNVGFLKFWICYWRVSEECFRSFRNGIWLRLESSWRVVSKCWVPFCGPQDKDPSAMGLYMVGHDCWEVERC